MPHREQQDALVYVIETAGVGCKIGFSVSPANRLRDFRTGNPTAELAATFDVGGRYREVERGAHGILRQRGFGIGGEWFACDAALAKAVIGHVAFARPRYDSLDLVIAYAARQKEPCGKKGWPRKDFDCRVLWANMMLKNDINLEELFSDWDVMDIHVRPECQIEMSFEDFCKWTYDYGGWELEEFARFWEVRGRVFPPGFGGRSAAPSCVGGARG